MKKGRRFYVETFGCQMNVNDSEKIAGLLQQEGHEPAPDAESADFVFVNTCAVREKAAEKLYHTLGRLRRLKESRPDLKVGVGGCVAQLHGEDVLKRAPGVDLLVGPRSFARVPELLRERESGEGTEPALVDLDRKSHGLDVPAEAVAHGNPVRAYVTVMEGCNHVCSFCVVPRTRGPELCRAPGAVVDEVRSLVGRGFPEVMLLGQTVNAYRHEGVDFAELLRRVDAVPDLRRLRFTTSHPGHVDTRMAEAFRDLERLCPYLHLPVQSGADGILAEMRRGYTAEEYRRTVGLLREHRPDLSLSTDVIVGYPGESEEDFEATHELVTDLGFDSLFSFMYSPRPGTVANLRPDDVPLEVKRRRLATLNSAQQAIQRERNARRVGSLQEVLVDTIDGPGKLSGRNPHFQIVHFEGDESLLGELVKVRVDDAGPNSLLGQLASK